MSERQSRTRRKQLLGVIPAILVYLAVVTVGPWLHLRAHDASVAAVQLESIPSDDSEELADVCELCRVLSVQALVVDAAPPADLPTGPEPTSEPPAAAPRPPAASGQPRAPPAVSHIA